MELLEEQVTNTITKIELIETREYQQQHHRNMVLAPMHTDVDAVSKIVRRSLASSSIGNTYNNIVNSGLSLGAINPISSGLAPIVNKWNSRRFKVAITMETSRPNTNVSTLTHVTGYSNYLGIAANGSIDENMIIHISKVHILRKSYDTNTGQVTVVPLDSHTISDFSNDRNFGNTHFLGRPDDVVTRMASLRTLDGIPTVSHVSDVGKLNKVQLTESKLTTPVTHIARTLQAAMDSRLLADAFSGDEDVVDTMVAELMSVDADQLVFMKLLRSIYGTNTDVSQFKLKDLELIDGVRNRVPNVYLKDNSEQVTVKTPPILLTNNTAESYDTSVETTDSIMILNSISAIVDELLISSITFTVENSLGAPNLAVLDITGSLEGLNLPMIGNTFKARFMREVYNQISYNGRSLVSLMVRASTTDVTIAINKDNRGDVVFRYPTFASGINSTLIHDNNSLGILAENFEVMIDTAIETTGEVMNESSRFSQNTMTNLDPANFM